MKKFITLSAVALTLFPMATSAFASPAHGKAMHAKMAAAMYQCQKCHMKVSAATAKKDHFVDPMDGGKLVPMKASSKPMAGMKM